MHEGRPRLRYCYAEGWAKRSGIVRWGPGAERRRTSEANWRLPVKWIAEAERLGVRYRVFCASLADVFDNEVPVEWRADLFDLIARTPNLDWLLVTKRIGNAKAMMADALHLNPCALSDGRIWPLPNVWLGISVVNQVGKYVADHMFICDYLDGEWQQPMIVPFANLSLSPATLALHYGQTVFEGMKAFRMHDGRVNIFRIEKNYDRFVRSLDRMCMAVPPKEMFVEGLTKLVELDKAWVPGQPGSALYLRRFVYASEAKFGVKISEQYRFIIFTGPVPELYAKPIKV